MQQHASTLPSAGQNKPIAGGCVFRVFFSGQQCTRSVAPPPSLHITHRRVFFREHSPHHHHSPNLIGASCAAGMGTILQERVPLPPQCLEGLSIRGREWKKRASWINSRPSGARYGGQVDAEDASVVCVSVLSPSLIHNLTALVFFLCRNIRDVCLGRLSSRKPPCFCMWIVFSDCGKMWVGVYNIYIFILSGSNKMGRRQSQRKPTQPPCALPRQDNKNEKVRNGPDDWLKAVKVKLT